MALLDQRSGCKVGWLTYSTEDEAEAASTKAVAEAISKAQRGYDFGYQSPGEVTHHADHPEHGECWVVVIP